MFSNKPSLIPDERANGLVDHTAADAALAIEATRQIANNAAHGLSQSVEALRQDATSVLNRVSDQAASLRQRGMDAVHDSSQRLRSQAQHASDSTLTYVREQPVKGLLMAVAAGAVLMALVGWAGRSRRDR
jgi:ElaB/YqjD/DUF883 family membrane-anchored ribosome-binding protein